MTSFQPLALLSKRWDNLRGDRNGGGQSRRQNRRITASLPASLHGHAELLEERLLLAAHPVISAPATATVAEDSALTFSKANGNAISVVYSSAAEPFTFSIGATNGTVTFKDTTGLTFNNGTKNGANAVSVVGTPTAINAALGAGVVYQPNNGFTGSDTLKLSAENGLVTSKGTATIAVTVTSPSPSVAVPLPSTVLEDNDLSFGTSTNNPFNVQDVAGTGNNVDSMNLSVSHGTLTIYNTANLLVLGSGTSSIAALGTVANLNAMLNGFTYTPTVGFNGTDSLTVTVIDSSDKESASKTATIYVTHWTDMTTASLTSEQNSGALGANFEMLLPNGDLMVQGGVNTPTTSWYEITPQNGSYANGTWSQLGSMNQARLFFSSDVLPNGDVFVFGGEFASDGAVWLDSSGNYVAPGTPGATQQYSPSAEIYDPTTNIWYPVASIPALYTITNYLGKTQNVALGGDQPSEVLPNGDVLVGNTFNAGTEIYVPQFGALGVPGQGSWETGPTKQYSEGGEESNEESWVKLGNGDILTYNIYSSYFDGVGEAELYVPSTTGGIGQWETASNGDLPILTAPVDGANEIGPALLLPNGDAFFGGPTGLTAFYDPKTGTWSQGPNLPQTLVSNGEGQLIPTQLGMDDGPGAVLPNGDLLLGLSPTDTEPNFPTEIAPGPTVIVEFNPTTQIFTYVTPSPGSINLTSNSFVNSMLVLPNSQVLLTNDGPNLTFYNLPGGDDPQDSWRPTITSFKPNANGSYTLTGTQLNGLDEGAAYGDDEQMAENYPIVRLRNLSTNVDYYATTSNWSSNWVATGSKPETVNVVLPTLPADTYQLVVIANGINSEPLTFVVPNGVRRPSGTSASVANADQIAGGSAPVEPDADSNSSPAPFAPASSSANLTPSTTSFVSSVDSGTTNSSPATGLPDRSNPVPSTAAELPTDLMSAESLQWSGLSAALEILSA